MFMESTLGAERDSFTERVAQVVLEVEERSRAPTIRHAELAPKLAGVRSLDTLDYAPPSAARQGPEIVIVRHGAAPQHPHIYVKEKEDVQCTICDLFFSLLLLGMVALAILSLMGYPVCQWTGMCTGECKFAQEARDAEAKVEQAAELKQLRHEEAINAHVAQHRRDRDVMSRLVSEIAKASQVIQEHAERPPVVVRPVHVTRVVAVMPCPGPKLARKPARPMSNRLEQLIRRFTSDQHARERQSEDLRVSIRKLWDEVCSLERDIAGADRSPAGKSCLDGIQRCLANQRRDLADLRKRRTDYDATTSRQVANRLDCILQQMKRESVDAKAFIDFVHGLKEASTPQKLALKQLLGKLCPRAQCA
jgi:Na+-transporting methylmalonyl-CoA/oxaloacetate decarboxylase gamma subunit